MGGRIEFREKLSGILKMAEENGCQITIDEVECYFEEEHLSKEQIELVFDYLLAQKIVVKGYEKTGGSVTSSEENKTVFTEEEQRYLKEYMKDIGGIREAAEEEREALFEKVLEGDALAKSRLVEIYLPEVVEIAKRLYHPEVFLGDLVQEGNVGLILGVDMIDDLDKAHDVIRREIRQAIQMLIEEQTELKNRDKKIVHGNVRRRGGRYSAVDRRRDRRRGIDIKRAGLRKKTRLRIDTDYSSLLSSESFLS